MLKVLILAGGSGTRFWPLSRRSRPKQLLALEGDRSLLRATFERLAPLVPPRDIWVCTTEALESAVAEQLAEVPRSQILAEPQGRNTAPAIGWSLVSMPREARSAPVAVLPADHRVADGDGFRKILATAAEIAASSERVLTLGVRPRWAETGYGYLEVGQLEDRLSGLRRVIRFVEKPGAESARRFVASGDYLWNAGIFVFRGTALLRHLERCQPEITAGLERIAADPASLTEAYAAMPSISIDHGVMEKLDDLGTLPLDCGWSDLGSWGALWDVLDKDGSGTAARGQVVDFGGGGNLLWADEGTIAVLGVKDLVVVRTGDAVLVVPRERAQEIRRVVSELEERGRDELL
jgi:mannose-1-phosphate guanylyltransferase